MTDFLTLPKLELLPKAQDRSHVVKLDRNLARLVHERVQDEHPGLRVSKRWAMEYALMQWLGVDSAAPPSVSQQWQVVLDDYC
jgi:hypothetical protein